MRIVVYVDSISWGNAAEFCVPVHLRFVIVGRATCILTMSYRLAVALSCLLCFHASGASRFLDMPRELVMDVNKGCYVCVCVCVCHAARLVLYFFVLLPRPFPIVNVIADQSGVASADTAVLQNSRQAERVRASAAAMHIAGQREAAKNIASEAAPLLNRLSKLSSAASGKLQSQSGHA